MRGLRVTAHYCAGQTRMYTFLYPYMGIMYTHVTMYIHNVRVTARVMYSTCLRLRISYPYMGTV